MEGATILIGGIFIGWKTRVSYVKHKYGDPTTTSVADDEDEVDVDYFSDELSGKLQQIHTMDLAAASRKLTASQQSKQFAPTNVNGVHRLDSIRFESNSPTEDHMTEACVDVGLGDDKKWDFFGVFDGHS